MAAKRPLILVPQGCCPHLGMSQLPDSFVAAKKPADKVIEPTRYQDAENESSLELTAVTGSIPRSYLRTSRLDAGFHANLYQAQLWIENNQPNQPCDIVIAVCHPPLENRLEVLAVVVQLTAAGHRVHTLMNFDTRSDIMRFANCMAANGVSQWLEHVDHLCKSIDELDN